MRFQLGFLFVAPVVFLVGASSTQAATVFATHAIGGGSFTVSIGLTTASGPWDLWAIRVNSAGDFLEGIATTEEADFDISNGFDPAGSLVGWSDAINGSGLNGVATGSGFTVSPPSALWFRSTFAGDILTEFVDFSLIVWLAGNNGTPDISADINFDPNVGVSFKTGTWNIDRASALSTIPIPTPLGMGLVGFGVLAMARRRR